MMILCSCEPLQDEVVLSFNLTKLSYHIGGYPLKDTCFPDITHKISFKSHFNKHDYVFIYFGSILKKYRSF